MLDKNEHLTVFHKPRPLRRFWVLAVSATMLAKSAGVVSFTGDGTVGDGVDASASGGYVSMYSGYLG